MKVQLELTDTFGGQANYGWVRRETMVLPDGTSDELLVMLARDWAGWRQSGVRTDTVKMGGNDDLELRPRGLAQVLFIVCSYDPEGISPDDLLRWANDITAALGTEDTNRVTAREKVFANAILKAHTFCEMRAFIDGEPQSSFVGQPTGDDALTRAIQQRQAARGN